MADDIHWQGVLQQVFAKYGSQLRRAEVKKFAAKFAKKQGRAEDKRDLKTSLKKFLSSDRGKKVVRDNNGMLSLEGAGPSTQAAPVKFSLLDLAEAADKMSKEQLDLAKSAKQGEQAAKLCVTGPRTARKRKAMDTSNVPNDPAPSGSPAMLTRTQLRRQGSNLHEAAMAADAAAIPVSAAAQKPQSSKQAADTEQLNPAQRTATLLPNGEVLTHLPLSQRGQEKPQKQASDAHRQKQPTVAAPSDNVKSASAASLQDNSTGKTQQDAKRANNKKHSRRSQPGGVVVTGTGKAAADVTDTSAALPHVNKPAAVHAEQGPSTAGAATGGPAKSKQKHIENSHTPPSAAPQPLKADAKAPATVGSAQPAQNTVKLNAEGAPDAAEQPTKKRKKQKHDKAVPHNTVGAAAADAQHASEAAAVQANQPGSTDATAAGTGAVGGASSSQQHEKAEDHEQLAVKTKKRKHKSKELRSPKLPAESPQREPAVVPEASHPMTARADAPAASSLEHDEPAVKPKKKKKRKDREPVRSTTAASHKQSQAIAGPVAVWPPSHALPAEVQDPAGPAEVAGVSVPAEPAGTSPKPKKRRRKDKVQPEADSAAPASAAAAALPDTQAAPGSEPSPPKPVSAAVETPAVNSKRKGKAKATADDSKAPTGSASAATEHPAADTAGLNAAEQPAAKAKRGPRAKAKAAAGSEPADVTPNPSTAKPKRGRPPKSAATPGNAAASASGLVPTSWREDQARTDVKRGKFSKQEKDILKQAAEEYAQEHSLPSNDFSWLFNTRTSEHKTEAAGAWQVIAQSLPHRTYKAVYACGTRMLHELNYQGKWSKEEDDKLRELVTERGPQWKDIGIVLGRLPEGCRDRWRDIKLGSRKQSGKWSEEESEKLRSLVSEYLALKQTKEGNAEADAALSLTLDDLVVGSKDTHGQQADGRIILDDIDWDVISARHGSRSAPQCLTKWYTQLAPSMVSKGDWGSGDDRRLLKALLRTGATHEFQVDWGNLIARNAAQTRRRWRLMLKCVKNATDHEFHENLHTLVQNFTPDLLPSDSAVEDAAAAAPADVAVEGA